MERQYVLKSLYKFYDGQGGGANVGVRQALSFYHHLDALPSRPALLSRPLAQLILDRCRELLSTPWGAPVCRGAGLCLHRLFGGRLDRTLALTPTP